MALGQKAIFLYTSSHAVTVMASMILGMKRASRGISLIPITNSCRSHSQTSHDTTSHETTNHETAGHNTHQSQQREGGEGGGPDLELEADEHGQIGRASCRERV